MAFLLAWTRRSHPERTRLLGRSVIAEANASDSELGKEFRLHVEELRARAAHPPDCHLLFCSFYPFNLLYDFFTPRAAKSKLQLRSSRSCCTANQYGVLYVTLI